MVDNWNKCIRSLNSRLVLAREKTHTVEQRARLSSAIAVPKITFLARHCWPPPSVVTRFKSMIQDVFGVSGTVRGPDLGPFQVGLTPNSSGGPCCAVHSNRVDGYGGNGCWTMGSYSVFKRFIDWGLLMGLYWV